jgi:hypothetical protein
MAKLGPNMLWNFKVLKLKSVKNTKSVLKNIDKPHKRRKENWKWSSNVRQDANVQ